MSTTGSEPFQDTEDSATLEQEAAGRVSFLDLALWKHFNEAETPEKFVQAWLALQCSLISGVKRAVAVLGEPDKGPFAPVAFWPNDGAPGEGLSQIAELALAERRGVVKGLEEARAADSLQRCHVAHPFLADGKIFGVVALELAARSRGQLRGVMRQLQWGVGWIEVMLRRDEVRGGRAQVERAATVFDFVGVALEARNFPNACHAVVTELATRLDCDQVSVGFVRRRRAVVAALSNAVQFGGRMNLIRDIGAAMDEAIDQGAMIVYPLPSDWEYRITRAHAELVRSHAAGAVVTVPLHCSGRFIGALAFERPAGRTFDPEVIALIDGIAAVLGPILEEQRRNDRLIIWKLVDSVTTQLERLLGPGFLGRKLLALAAAGTIAILWVAKDEHRVTAPALLEGVVQRVIVAPFDGYIASQHARAGDVVRAEQILLVLDDQDLVLERLRWSTLWRERMVKYDRALTEGERAEAKVVQAQIDEAVAQVSLLDAQIARTRIRAPFEAVVIAGDLSQSVGAAVRRGDQLFQIAPLDAYRIVLEVDESDISDMKIGQRGSLLISALPEGSFAYTVERLTPITEAKEGRNYYRVEAQLDVGDPRLRPGMTGIGKTAVEDRLLIRIWTDRLINWLRLQVWRWIP